MIKKGIKVGCLIFLGFLLFSWLIGSVSTKKERSLGKESKKITSSSMLDEKMKGKKEGGNKENIAIEKDLDTVIEKISTKQKPPLLLHMGNAIQDSEAIADAVIPKKQDSKAAVSYNGRKDSSLNSSFKKESPIKEDRIFWVAKRETVAFADLKTAYEFILALETGDAELLKVLASEDKIRLLKAGTKATMREELGRIYVYFYWGHLKDQPIGGWLLDCRDFEKE